MSAVVTYCGCDESKGEDVPMETCSRLDWLDSEDDDESIEGPNFVVPTSK